MQNFYKLPLVLDPQPEGGWTITCPVLPELITEADTWEEIEPNVSDALQAVIEIYEHLKKPMPYVLKPINGDALLLTDTIVHLEAA
ncbi:MAG: type II toxin-antitoxin system HicB family antitoxin [Pyrinomonadaceae bacterium]